MVKLRVQRAAMTSLARLRVHDARLTGTVVNRPQLRLHHVGITGTAAVQFRPVAQRVVEPLEPVTVTVTLATGSSTPDSYTWRVVSGPAVTLSGSGATRSFVAPHTRPPNGGEVVLGVTGLLAGAPGPETLISVFVLPQTNWTWDGSAWVGAGRLPV